MPIKNKNTKYYNDVENRYIDKIDNVKYPFNNDDIPFIPNKQIVLTNAGSLTGASVSTNLLDSIAKYSAISGLSLKKAIGLASKESTLGNPTYDVSGLNRITKGNIFKGKSEQVINDEDVTPSLLVNYNRHNMLNPYVNTLNLAIKKGLKGQDKIDFLNSEERYVDKQADKVNNMPVKPILQAAFEDYKRDPRNYNPGQDNYVELVDKKANEAFNSPEIQNWYKTSRYINNPSGDISDKEYYSIMEKVAKDNYKDWGFDNEDEALIHALNDNTYNYRAYYNKYPNGQGNALNHWTDEFKTAYHPTFSDESTYSGKVSEYNPYGAQGGHWIGDSYMPNTGDFLNKQYKDMTNRRSLKCGGRPKAFWGALVGELVNTAAGYFSSKSQADMQQKLIDEQNRIAKQQNEVANNNNLAGSLNNYALANSQVNNDTNLKFSLGGNTTKGKRLSDRVTITDGGNALPIGNNTFLLRGSSHEDVNESGKTGIGIKVGNKEIEAEGGEVAQKSGKTLKIFSKQPMFADGTSPAEKVIEGVNPTVVFNQQEKVKDLAGINDDGTTDNTLKCGGKRKSKYGSSTPVGKRDKAAFGLSLNGSDYVNLGVESLGSLANSFISNANLSKIKYNYTLPSYVDEVPVALNTQYNNDAQRSVVERNRLNGISLIRGNTSSSVSSLGRMQSVNNDAMLETNKLWDDKANKETELRNQSLINEQSVRSRNVSSKNQYYQNVANIENNKVNAENEIAKIKSQNIINGISGVTQSLSNTFSQAEQRKEDQNAQMAYLAASDKGTASRLISSGYNFDPAVLNGLYKSGLQENVENPGIKPIRSNYSSDNEYGAALNDWNSKYKNYSDYYQRMSLLYNNLGNGSRKKLGSFSLTNPNTLSNP